jgi:hypothetical protein
LRADRNYFFQTVLTLKASEPPVGGIKGQRGALKFETSKASRRTQVQPSAEREVHIAQPGAGSRNLRRPHPQASRG